MASILVLQAINPAACDGPCAPAAQLGPVVVSADGVARGLAFVARVGAMAVAAFVVFASTRPSDLFAALARLRVPYAVNLATALTLQLVPLLEREARTIIAAQRARGRRASGPGALVPAIVPMFAMTVERAERLAIAMESRGVGSSGPVTSYRRLELRVRDRALAAAGIVAGVAGVAIALAGSTPPPPAVPDPLAVAIFWAALVAFAVSLGATVRSLTRA